MKDGLLLEGDQDQALGEEPKELPRRSDDIFYADWFSFKEVIYIYIYEVGWMLCFCYAHFASFEPRPTRLGNVV